MLHDIAHSKMLPTKISNILYFVRLPLLQDNLANTPVFLAIDTNDNEIMDMITQHRRTNFSVMNAKGFNALHHAALKGNTQ